MPKMKHPEFLCAVESSCDDTSIAILRNGEVLSNIVSSQHIHNEYGGVVPELASRAHQQFIVPVMETALAEANISVRDLTAVAATYGPGLAGSLLVGLSFSKALALGLGLPFVGVNHMEGHLYSVFLEPPKPPFPYLCLTVSGGHTELTIVEKNLKHSRLGKTRDDAAGEAFDKVAKMLGLGYPGGPAVDRLARTGNPEFHRFPRTRVDGHDFSFSGLKTSVLYYLGNMTETDRDYALQNHLSDICASFQAAVVDTLVHALMTASEQTGIKHLAVVGGVSANSSLREAVKLAGQQSGCETYIPPMRYCMDNAAMIGIAGHFKLASGVTSPLTLTAKPNLSV